MEALQNLPQLTQAAVAGLLIFGFYVHAAKFNAKSAIEAPAIFTTCGIFFTFVGIALGLLNFKVSDIQASVPALLDGLKTAFLASVVGVFIALTIKLRYALWGVPAKNRNTDVYGATIDDLVKQLIGVQQSLVGDDDSTLLSQMKLSR